MGAEASVAAVEQRTQRFVPRGRLFGLGSVFGKTLRDSRRAIVIAIVMLVLLTVSGGAAVATAFGTPETRKQAAELALGLPAVFQGLLGKPVGLTTLGGFIEWRYHSVYFLLLPIWSILALSGTLASEAARGSLEVVATSGLSRRRIAVQKVAAHLTGVGLVMVVFAVMIYLIGVVFATLPGDEISPAAAFSYTILTLVLTLLPGSIAFAASPFVSRGAAAGLGAVLMIGTYVVNGFRDSVPIFENLTPLSWYSWTSNHVPLAGLEDWPSLLGPAVLIVVLLTVGVVGFERRDIGSTIRIPSPRLPGFLLGLRGPMGRAFGERIPTALAWGAGLGLYVLLLSSTIQSMADLFKRLPTIEALIRAIYPNVDFESVGGMLQLVFVEFGLVIFGFAAASIVAGWASDETRGRLEEVLSTPLTRAAWLVRSGLGAFLAIGLSATIVALGTGIGAIVQGSEVVTPFVGTYVLALYGLAWAGVAIAAAGVFRSSIAAPVAVALTVGTFLISTFAPPLKLPDWVADLALPTHYGSPLVGDWDPVGVVASLVLAFGGLLVGAWGLSRRDVRV